MKSAILVDADDILARPEFGPMRACAFAHSILWNGPRIRAPTGGSYSRSFGLSKPFSLTVEPALRSRDRRYDAGAIPAVRYPPEKARPGVQVVPMHDRWPCRHARVGRQPGRRQVPGQPR